MTRELLGIVRDGLVGAGLIFLAIVVFVAASATT